MFKKNVFQVLLVALLSVTLFSSCKKDPAPVPVAANVVNDPSGVKLKLTFSNTSSDLNLYLYKNPYTPSSDYVKSSRGFTGTESFEVLPSDTDIPDGTYTIVVRYTTALLYPGKDVVDYTLAVSGVTNGKTYTTTGKFAANLPDSDDYGTARRQNFALLKVVGGVYTIN